MNLGLKAILIDLGVRLYLITGHAGDGLDLLRAEGAFQAAAVGELGCTLGR